MRARMVAEAGRIGFDERFLDRPLNVDLSGGEKKRNETLQLGVLDPRIAILDELDSGLDVDALRACARRVEAATETGLGVLSITHYNRLLDELRADACTSWSGARSAPPAGPSWPTSWRTTATPAWIRPEDHMAASAPRPIDVFGEHSFADQEPVAEDPFGAGPFGADG